MSAILANPIVGSGAFVYEAIHDWLTPPDGLVWGDTHGVAQDSQGRIYIGHTVGEGSRSKDAIASLVSVTPFLVTRSLG